MFRPAAAAPLEVRVSFESCAIAFKLKIFTSQTPSLRPAQVQVRTYGLVFGVYPHDLSVLLNGKRDTAGTFLRAAD
jgi:hypothetical protein